MFNDNQEKKIKQFATVTKLANTCFIKCCDISLIKNQSNLSKEEEKCLLNCVNSYLELNNNVINQLLKDKEEIEVKNKIILETKT